MSELQLNSQCWYKIINDKFKLESEQASTHGIAIDKCVECKYLITSKSYQQNSCGSRYCKDCFDKLKTKYCCSICKEEDSSNFVHKREDIFLDKAMIKDLEKIKLSCPDCKLELKLIDLEDHVRNHCESGWMFCNGCQTLYKKTIPHKCQKGLDQSKDNCFPNEVCEACGKKCSKGKHECVMNWKKRCPYGCKVEPSELVNHRNSAQLNHLDIICSILKETGITNFRQNHESIVCPLWLQCTLKQIERDCDCHPGNVRPLLDIVMSLQQETTEEISINNIIKENVEGQMADLSKSSFDGTMTWKIENFPKIRKNAIDGVQKSIFSPPFFTSRFGYKMCLRLYPNGDTTAWGVAMSLFLVIMKGDYDELLKWPFKQKVTFILVDPDFKTNWIDAFIPSENMSSFSRPRTDMNIPSGSSYFIKFEDLNTNSLKYAKDDTMFIRCIVDCSDIPL